MFRLLGSQVSTGYKSLIVTLLTYHILANALVSPERIHCTLLRRHEVGTTCSHHALLAHSRVPVAAGNWLLVASSFHIASRVVDALRLRPFVLAWGPLQVGRAALLVEKLNV